jgi:hypothetical protein
LFSVLLLMLGVAISAYCLWQLRRWLSGAEAAVAAGPKRLEALVDELVATAEATVAAVEEKAESLAVLLEEADVKLAKLKGTGSGGEGPTVAKVTAAAQARPVELASVHILEPVVRQPEPFVSPVVIPAQPQGATTPELHAEVYRLLDAGTDQTGIARQLGISRGEVHLILGLRRSS